MLPADLLDRLLPDTEPTERWEAENPPRDLPDGAEVTRFAPSPTGFLHIGGVYTAMVAKELAERTSGAYFVRVEDTDQARIVAGSDEQFARAFAHFGIEPTESPDAAWGPYRQSERAEIYRSFVRALLESGHAYPDFATREELADITERQQAAKVDLGYWGEWAVWRDAPAERVAEALDAGLPFTIRFRAPDQPGRVAFDDAIRGRIEADDNRNDVVLLKSSAEPLPLPTYHLAHAVDDHLMRVTLVLRGDEWISSVPLHLQLFGALGFEPVRYAHVAPLMKGEGKSRRKLSKRKDPEASVDFWMAEGYPVGAVRHYLRGLANSRLADLPFDDAATEPLRLEEFGASGPLVDIPKLDDISADFVATLPAVEIRDHLLAWADEHDTELAQLLRDRGDGLLAVIDVDRVDTDRVRKDIVKWSVFRERYGFFFPELFTPVTDPADERFLGVPPEVVSAFAADFVAGYDDDTASPTWFDQVRDLAERHGFALDRKAHKADPDAFHGTMREASNIVRVTLTGSGQSPSLDQIAGVLGADEVRRRVGAPAG